MRLALNQSRKKLRKMPKWCLTLPLPGFAWNANDESLQREAYFARKYRKPTNSYLCDTDCTSVARQLSGCEGRGFVCL